MKTKLWRQWAQPGEQRTVSRSRPPRFLLHWMCSSHYCSSQILLAILQHSIGSNCERR